MKHQPTRKLPSEVSGGCDFNSKTRFSPVQSRVQKSYPTFSSRHLSTSLPASVLSVLTRAKVLGGVLFHSKSCRVFSSPKFFRQRSTSHSGCDQPSAGWEIFMSARIFFTSSNSSRSEERRVGKECRSRWSPY